MAINNYYDNTDINVYFHMKNHYKKLRSARSTIDNSLPQSFIKICSTPPNSGRSLRSINFEDRNIKNDPHLPINSDVVKKHSCMATSVTGTSNTSIKTINIPPRRKTSCSSLRTRSMDSKKRKGNSTKLSRANKSKVVDKEPTIGGNKSESALNGTENLVIDCQPTVGEPDKCATDRSKTSKACHENFNTQPRVEEHEYLQFLLRITEDIIINNLYTNEDIEKVFQTHIEAHKDHLKMEKMEAQLVRLSTELDIPYRNSKNNSRESECYEHFFNSQSSDHDQKLEDCECTTKRTLDVEINKTKSLCQNERKEENTEFYLQKICNILVDKCSLDRVTECTEYSNSMDAIIGFVKQLSSTNVHSSHSSFKNQEINDECLKETLNLVDVPPDAKEISCNEGLTEKEKLGCKEEEILFEKLNISINEIEDNNTEPENQNTKNDVISNENTKDLETNISLDNLITNTTEQAKEKSDMYLNIFNNDINMLVENLNINSPKTVESCGEDYSNYSKFQSSEKSNVDLPLSQKCEENHAQYLTNTFLINNMQNKEEANIKAVNECSKCDEIETNSLDNMVPMKENIYDVKVETSSKAGNEPAETELKVITNDQSTQMELAQSDKECNTSIILTDYSKSDYVLLNGPVYVLKTVLNAEERLVIYDKDNTIKDAGKEIDPRLSDKGVTPIHCDTIPILETQPKLDYVPPYMRDNFSKLLSSDYDLMPQRDSDASDKYHHLLVDATTSMSNINLNAAVYNMFTNPNALLLTDKYELMDQFHKEENLICETDNIKLSTHNRNDIQFGDELCTNSQYDLKSAFLKEVSNRLNVSSSVVNDKIGILSHEPLPELDTPLTRNEQFSPDIKESGVISKDPSESGEVVKAAMCTDDELSQISTFISDNERISTNVSPNHNILGKRKLKHPL